MESWFLSGSHAQNYEAGIDPTTPHKGKSSGYIADFSALFQLLNAHSRVLFEALQREQKLIKEVEQLKAQRAEARDIP